MARPVAASPTGAAATRPDCSPSAASTCAAIDPKTGKLLRSFGANGRVDLLPGMGPQMKSFSWTSAPQICNDVVLIGASMTDSPGNKEEPPGKVQAFDVRTGKPRWAFNPIPRPGEVGSETWENDSWSVQRRAPTCGRS